MPNLEGIFQFGHAGVDLFFVISGFVILFIHLDDIGMPGRIRRYLERRLTRVLPAYWIALGTTIVLAAAGGHSPGRLDIFWSVLPVPLFSEPILGVAWTLQYEFVFYAVFAVLILSRAVGSALMLVWLGMTVAGIIWTNGITVPGAFYGIFNLEFFAGMAIAYWLRRRTLRWYGLVLIIGLALFAAAAIAEDLKWMDGYTSFARLAYGVPCTLLVLGAAEASRRGTVRVPVILQTLGSASYSLYLFQFVIIGVAWKLWLAASLDKVIPPEVGFVLFAAVVIVGGIFISRWVEYPLMNLIRSAVRRTGARKAFDVAPDVPVS